MQVLNLALLVLPFFSSLILANPIKAMTLSESSTSIDARDEAEVNACVPNWGECTRNSNCCEKNCVWNLMGYMCSPKGYITLRDALPDPVTSTAVATMAMTSTPIEGRQVDAPPTEPLVCVPKFGTCGRDENCCSKKCIGWPSYSCG